MIKNQITISENGEQYHLLDQVIGEGSFSVVRKGFNQKSKEVPVAVKIVRQQHYQMATNQVSILKMLNTPLTQLSQISQSYNVLKLLDSFFGFNEFYIITEVFGVSLSSVLPKYPSPDYLSGLRNFRQILGGYEPLRNKRILHRDIKPSNILVELNNHGQIQRAKFCDFGLSTILKQKETLFRQQHVGTIMYEAPEVIKFREYSEKSQIWSLGLILFELIYGRLPFDFNDPLLYDCTSTSMYKIVMGSPIRFLNIPQEIANLGERCLCRSSQKRIDFKSLIDQIDSILQNSSKMKFLCKYKNYQASPQTEKKKVDQPRALYKDQVLTTRTNSRKNSPEIISEQELLFHKFGQLLTKVYKELKVRFESMKKPKKASWMNLLSLCDEFAKNQQSIDYLKYFSYEVLDNLAISLAKLQIICEYSLDEKQISFNLKQFMFIDTLFLLFSVTKSHLQGSPGWQQRKNYISMLENHLSFEGNSKTMGYYKQLRNKVLGLNLKQYKQMTSFNL